ncbi:MAG: RagB/SusD family nutrient uptake outer membrane protein [Arachidicoccus sp.]|nr:RagB/SusD family nutrient uptake outer membrane protein [Arachidicoccus sp.]
MNINNKNSIFFLVLVILSTTSCSKSFITQNPNGSISANLAITDEASAQAALNGVYQELTVPSLYGRDLIVIGDLLADNTFVETRNSGRYLPEFNYTITNSDGVFGEIWNAAYTAIMRANRLIDADVTGIDQIKSQAYALRALLYLKLLNIYSRPYTDAPSGYGVPLILHYDPSLLPTRDSISKVYNQIISDLTTAFNTAPDYTNSVTLSKYSIEGLLAKTYLYMGDYANAKTHAEDVIKNSGFKLTNGNTYLDFWHNPAVQTDKVEVMFEVDENSVNNNSSDDLGAMFYNGYSDIYATKEIDSLYSETDIRKKLLIDSSTKSGASAYIVDKYINAGSSDKDNPKVIRLSEVYLIAAEASFGENSVSDAQTYLNDLATVRDPSITRYTSTGSQLLIDIVNERRKELAFEGDRIYDLNRLKLEMNRGSLSSGSIPGPLSVPYSDYRRIAPIPLAEIQANQNIADQQNPEYDK